MSTALAIPDPSMLDRPSQVLSTINLLKNNISSSFLALGKLLLEARNKKYHQVWGYPRFADWAESASGMNLSARECYYLINIVERSAELGIGDEQLEKVQISNLKVIFSLPKETPPEKIRELVAGAEHMSLKELRSVAGSVKDEDFVYHTLKFGRDTEDNVYQPAVERQRRLYGDTVDEAGDPSDISESRVVELWAAECLAGQDDPEPTDAEFEDQIETQ